MKVFYVPPQVPSPVREGSEEGSSPRASVSENGAVNTSELNNVSFSMTSLDVINYKISPFWKAELK